MSKELDEFERLLHDKQKRVVKAQIIWAKVKSVDWDDKSMTATSLIDGLDYYKISLGLSSFYRKPVIGTLCRLGVLENQISNTFLIDAEAFDEGIFTSGDSEFTIKTSGFILKRDNENLGVIISDMIDEINKILVVQGNNINRTEMMAIKQRLNTVLIE